MLTIELHKKKKRSEKLNDAVKSQGRQIQDDPGPVYTETTVRGPLYRSLVSLSISGSGSHQWQISRPRMVSEDTLPPNLPIWLFLLLRHELSLNQAEKSAQRHSMSDKFIYDRKEGSVRHCCLWLRDKWPKWQAVFMLSSLCLCQTQRCGSFWHSESYSMVG